MAPLFSRSLDPINPRVSDSGSFHLLSHNRIVVQNHDILRPELEPNDSPVRTCYSIRETFFGEHMQCRNKVLRADSHDKRAFPKVTDEGYLSQAQSASPGDRHEVVDLYICNAQLQLQSRRPARSKQPSISDNTVEYYRCKRHRGFPSVWRGCFRRASYFESTAMQWNFCILYPGFRRSVKGTEMISCVTKVCYAVQNFKPQHLKLIINIFEQFRSQYYISQAILCKKIIRLNQAHLLIVVIYYS